jgi:haloacetate dehalogenase
MHLPYFDQFTTHAMQVNGATIYGRVGGQGPPLLLLHGCPQSQLMWRKLAGALSQRFTVVATDLRGYW